MFGEGIGGHREQGYLDRRFRPPQPPQPPPPRPVSPESEGEPMFLPPFTAPEVETLFNATLINRGLQPPVVIDDEDNDFYTNYIAFINNLRTTTLPPTTQERRLQEYRMWEATQFPAPPLPDLPPDLPRLQPRGRGRGGGRGGGLDMPMLF